MSLRVRARRTWHCSKCSFVARKLVLDLTIARPTTFMMHRIDGSRRLAGPYPGVPVPGSRPIIHTIVNTVTKGLAVQHLVGRCDVVVTAFVDEQQPRHGGSFRPSAARRFR